MGSAADLLRRLQRFDPDKAADDALQENIPAYLDLQKDQLKQGISRYGSTIKPPYQNKYYARKKNLMNGLPGLGNPDLLLTGARNDGMGALLDNDVIRLDSEVEYNKYLEENYGPGQIWGLTDRNMETFRGDVRVSLQRIITDQTGLK